MSRDTFGCHNWGSATGHSWVEAMEAAKCATTQRTSPHTKNRAVQNINRAKEEKSCLR